MTLFGSGSDCGQSVKSFEKCENDWQKLEHVCVPYRLAYRTGAKPPATSALWSVTNVGMSWCSLNKVRKINALHTEFVSTG